MSLCKSALFACSLLASGVALAQTSPASWPTRPVTFVIPYAPGSATETDSRLYANKMSENLGQPFVLDFKPGGSTMIAAQYAANAAPDGQGGTQHLHGVWMHGIMGIEPTYIHYKGIGPMIPDLIAGRVGMGTMSVSASMALVKGGKLRILGYGGRQRFAGLPDVPTMAEQGVTGFEYLSWLGRWPPRLPPRRWSTRSAPNWSRRPGRPRLWPT